jgi:endo-1,4-beta-D-glucanase Y
MVVLSQTKPGNLTVSEAHGYGMVILAYIAGHDPKAKQRFDSMARYHHAHPSKETSGLMAWYQNDDCEDAGGKNSATDGDLDIAYAYLLADAQWGSDGDIDYAERAEWVISAISARGLHGRGIYPLLGDWVTPADRFHYRGARVSDFMGGHFRAFAAHLEDPLWLGVLDNTYWIAETLQLTAARETGLLPDFAQNLQHAPIPAQPGFLEGARDGSYAYNACRIPLRMGTDFALSGDPRARRIAQRINRFVKKQSGGDPSKLRGGYHLSGEAMVDYETMAFTAPLTVGAMTDPKGQPWLDALWQHMLAHPTERYYEDTLKMLSMIVVSGNWWTPQTARRKGG